MPGRYRLTSPSRDLTVTATDPASYTEADVQASAASLMRERTTLYGALPGSSALGLAGRGELPGEAVDRFEVDFANADQRHGVDFVEIDWCWNEQARQPRIGQSL